MINSEVNCNVLGNSGTGMPPDYKHSPLVKKIALRDVQNDNRSLIHSHPECSPDLEKHILRTIKEELTRQQSQMRESNLYCAPEVRRNHMASMMTFPYGGPAVSNSIEKHGNGQPAADSKATDDQLRKERYLHLQKFLKQCDEFIQRDYIQVLVNVSPAELSRHAIELEKRAIQLTVEEASRDYAFVWSSLETLQFWSSLQVQPSLSHAYRPHNKVGREREGYTMVVYYQLHKMLSPI
ncbi:hypothetical protein Acr_00g0042970 [Actinidia rufa]|uniref:Uncharacterized protein n=1 Tax=Actinidia rufa TaxID=165716 RepID=A0A7J0DIN9_9ERIC|nr:hypothetical protein Acr_00g0042970 [Actinidia rufa]